MHPLLTGGYVTVAVGKYQDVQELKRVSELMVVNTGSPMSVSVRAAVSILG